MYTSTIDFDPLISFL